ncbi:hypothetical protein I350_00014 [Cryptococcus amylolentus CBS 6273]|uniref:Uncharacterized protein n=1 Tax=Cryptococcus amylolentus CBS 6273 TaxID=1296118 RepID=A0A1E3KDS6_9TREE|nr:hypothetical protein I350_00014 [Cryptococcus amylolentus CBS 6273]
MPVSKYSSSTYHRGGIHPNIVRGEDGSISIVPPSSEFPTKQEEEAVQDSSGQTKNLSRAEYIAQRRSDILSRGTALMGEGTESDTLVGEDDSALTGSSAFSREVLESLPRNEGRARSEDAEEMRKTLEEGGWVVMSEDGETEKGWTTFSFVDTLGV